MIYVIGDIHGEFEELRSLLGHLKKDATEYIFLGDYVDKGGMSKQSVDLLIALSRAAKCVFLMGDHEFAWFEYLNGNERFADFLLNYGGVRTLESYSGRNLSPEDAREFLSDRGRVRKLLKQHDVFYSDLRLYHYIGNEYICVHGGINPVNADKPLSVHNKEEMVFIRNEFIKSRFLYNGMRVIFGHTAFAEPYVDKYKIGIDIGAVYEEPGFSGRLMAFNVTKGEFIGSDGVVSSMPNAG